MQSIDFTSKKLDYDWGCISSKFDAKFFIAEAETL